VIGFYGLSLTYLDDFLKNVEAVTLPEIREAFKRRIDVERMVTVVVGASEPDPESSRKRP
jgi:zinc protease